MSDALLESGKTYYLGPDANIELVSVHQYRQPMKAQPTYDYGGCIFLATALVLVAVYSTLIITHPRRVTT